MIQRKKIHIQLIDVQETSLYLKMWALVTEFIKRGRLVRILTDRLAIVDNWVARRLWINQYSDASIYYISM